jgi:hypothetical protein
MKLKNHDVIQGDTLIVATPFEAIADDGKLQEFLIGTRVELEDINPLSPASEVGFKFASKNYRADDSYFVTIDHWFSLRNQLKYIEDDQVKPKTKPVKNVPSELLGVVEVFVYLFVLSLLIWGLCAFFTILTGRP